MSFLFFSPEFLFLALWSSLEKGLNSWLWEVLIYELRLGLAQRASLNPIKEMPGLVPGTQSRPGDNGFENWIDGNKMAFDVSVVSPTQNAILHRAAEFPAAAIEMRKTAKNLC